MDTDSLSVEVIEKLEDVCEGFSLLQKHGISTNCCQSLQDIKDRLKLHHCKVTGQQPQFHTVSQSYTTQNK